MKKEQRWVLILAAAVGAILLTLFAYLWHNFLRQGSWPTAWW